MRTQPTILCVAVLLATMACETVTEPHPVDPIAVWSTSEASLASGYTALLLPEGQARSLAEGRVVIDESGGVFGTVLDGSTNTERAAKWTVDADGQIAGPVRLGELPMPYQAWTQHVGATNPDGEVVLGFAQENPWGPTTIPWLWASGSMMVLLKPEGATRAWPQAMNDAGMVVGQVRFGSDGDYGGVWLPPYDTEPILLPVLENRTLHSPRGVTNTGVITGMVRGGDLPDAIVQWQVDPDGNLLSGPEQVARSDGFFMGAEARDLDVPGGFELQEAAVFRLDEGRRIDLGWLDGHDRGHARAATDRSEGGSIRVVGLSYSEGEMHMARATLWVLDASGSVGGPVDLGLPDPHPTGRPGHRFAAARSLSVNSQGQITGYSQRADGAILTTLWQPASGGGDDEPPPSDGPVASFDHSCSNSAECQFVDTSTGQIVAWEWTTTAGHTSTDVNVTFTFTQEGSYTVTLMVTDEAGMSDQASASLSCRMHPRFGLRCS